MLAVVRKPHIELSMSGERVGDLVEWINRKFPVTVLSADDNEEVIPVEETNFYREMQKNRIGNLLEAARLRAGLTQKELAEKTGLKQNMISDYERSKRRLTRAMARRIAAALDMPVERLSAQ